MLNNCSSKHGLLVLEFPMKTCFRSIKTHEPSRLPCRMPTALLVALELCMARHQPHQSRACRTTGTGCGFPATLARLGMPWRRSRTVGQTLDIPSIRKRTCRCQMKSHSHGRSAMHRIQWSLVNCMQTFGWEKVILERYRTRDATLRPSETLTFYQGHLTHS